MNEPPETPPPLPLDPVEHCPDLLDIAWFAQQESMAECITGNPEQLFIRKFAFYEGAESAFHVIRSLVRYAPGIDLGTLLACVTRLHNCAMDELNDMDDGEPVPPRPYLTLVK